MNAYICWYLADPLVEINSVADLLQWQAKRCAMCGKRTTLVCDHDHVTGKVRGYLCNGCNIREGRDRGDWALYRARPPITLFGVVETYSARTPKVKRDVVAGGVFKPRSRGVYISRDELILQLLNTADRGFSRQEIAQQLNITDAFVFLSCWRLTTEGKVRRRNRLWERVTADEELSR